MPQFRIRVTERVIVTRSCFVTVEAETAELAKVGAEEGAEHVEWEAWGEDSTEADGDPSYWIVQADGSEDIAAGFAVVPVAGGFRLVDCDTFNSWESAGSHVFPTRAGAADYAQRCDDFKRGRSMNVGPYERAAATQEG